MSKRINITVSDELDARLERVKNEFNVSKVCQEALLQKVRAVEISKQGDLIDFLRVGKWEFEEKYRDMGREWAEKAIQEKEVSYKKLIELAEEHLQATKNPKRLAVPDALVFLIDRELSVPDYRMEGVDIFADEPTPGKFHDPMFNEEAFVRGYIEKAWEVLESVKDKI